ncbi:hypothetical protein [Flavobacterium sp. 3HN19-14]
MNVIALFEKLELDKSAVGNFTAEDIIRVEKKLNATLRADPEIDLQFGT